ncbi:MAG: DUF4282 domain-containing protein [Alphaproteobacteria bacterium]|nr:DUF4282 domain-containing protein [Alphaproteobacteria bacterium]
MSFDKLIATTLIKVLYWIGMAGIALGVLVQLAGALVMITRSPMVGLGMLIAVPIGGVIAVLFWRFLCEIYIVIFGIYDRLGEIRDKPNQ